MLRTVLVIAYVVCVNGFSNSSECDLQCRGLRLLNSVTQKFPADEVRTSDGVKFVKTGGNGTVSDSILSLVKNFFRNYDLRVNLQQLMPKTEDWVPELRSGLQYLTRIDSEGETSGRGSGGGGKKGNGVMAMAAMMGGMMAALGFGSLGMLAMKALTVSAMALMMAKLMWLKKMMDHSEHSGHSKSSHIVQYVPLHQDIRRRRRDIGLPFRGYTTQNSTPRL